uniref:Uncharacterized protein n=1 Tax=Chromera velia CCMP2878 TaxID=1169474 RepID=A0A0G4HF99_9ALVE|eukprot:Cvel_26979.t1-p1 / transcript=Cvel_26979.t1 / gene=Cvel_26979 / organism=Chromera_velia_CCMP2878 / gene_product=hypothetical protein / transcript_product=hypothetical protein / location=Cvel_scaffold3293:13993-18171(-) / protein_length=1047 / sequence_SO=supercontig / SO=protein_coding / is_pseudo=false
MALGETAPPSPPLAVIPEREPSDTSAGPRGNGHKETGVPPAFSSSSSSNSGSGQETRQNGSSVSALPSSPTRIMKQEEAARGGSAAASAHRERGRDEDTRMQDVSGDRGGVTVPLSVHPQHQSSADYPAAAAASSGTPFHHHGGGQGGPFAHQHPPPQPNGHPPPHLLHAHAAGGGGAVPFHSMYPQPQQQQVSDQMYMDPDHQSVHGPGGDPNGYGGSGHFQLIDLLPPGVADVRNRLHEGHDWFGDGLPPWIPLGDEGRRAVRKGIAEVLRGPHAALGRELIKEMIPTGAWADAQVPVLGQLAIRMGHYKLLVETTAAFMERYLAHGGTGGNMNVKEGETGDGMGVHGGMGLGAMPEMEERNPHITQMQMQMRAGRDGNSIPGPGAENSASASSASSSSSSSSAGAIRDPDPSGRGPGMNGVGLKKRARGGAGGGEDSSVGVGESIDGSRGGKRLQTTGQTDVEEEVHMGGEGDVYGSHVHSHGMPGPLQHGEVGGPLSGVGGMGMGLGPAGEWMMIEGGQEETPRSFALQLTAIGGVEGGGVSVGSAGRGELLCLSPGFRPSSPLQYQQGGVPMHHHASHGLSPHSHSGGRSGRGGGAIRGRRGGRGGGTGGSGPSSAGVLNGPPGGASSSSSSSSSTPDGNAVRGGNANADAPPLQVPIPHASERDGDALFDLNLGLGHAHNSQLGPISMPLHGHITPSTTLHRQMQMQMVPVWPHAVSSQAPLSSLDGGTGPHAMEFGFSERGGDMDMGTVPSGLDGHPELTALSAGGEGEGEEEEGPPRVGREGLRPRQQRQKQSQEHSGGVSSPSVNGGSRVGGKRGRGQTSMSILSPASDILPSGGLTDFLSPVNGLPPSHPFPSASPSSPHEALAQAVSSSSSSPRRPRRGGGEQGEGAQGGAAFASASPSRGPGNSKEIEGAGGPASRTRSHDASSDPPHGGGQGTRPSQQAQGGRGAQVQEETEVRSGHGESLSGGSRGTRGGRGGRGGRAGGASSTSHTHAQGSHSVSSSQQQRQQPSSPSPSALTTGDEGAGRRVTRASRRQAA